MTSIRNHSDSLIAFMVVVFFAASSGFTAVLRQCNMEAMSCCPTSQTQSSQCDESLPAKTARLAQADMTCHSTTVVGGLLTNPALLVKEAKQEFKKSISEIIPLASVLSNNSQHLNQHSSLLASPTAVFGPSVEKYVLNASLLI